MSFYYIPPCNGFRQCFLQIQIYKTVLLEVALFYSGMQVRCVIEHVWVRGGGPRGVGELPARGIRASQGTLISILLKLCRHCDHALKIRMWLGYTPRLIFVTFFYNLNLVIFWTFLNLESDLPVGGIVFHKHIF